MTSKAAVSTQSGQDALVVRVVGDWISDTARPRQAELESILSSALAVPKVRFDLSGLDRLDTVGAWLLVTKHRDLAKAGAEIEFAGASEQHRRLIERIGATSEEVAPAPARDPLFMRPFIALGRSIVGIGSDTVEANAVQGRLLAALANTALLRGRFRFTAFINQFDLIVFRAVPIVTLISLVVGAIVTQQSIMQLRNFGAAIFVVDLAAILMLREVGLLLAAIMVAGRSGSAITAEIGSMRMREEIDALNVMGVDPYQALILPRTLALVIGLPILAFIGAIAGLAGAALVAQIYGDIPFSTFLDRLQGALNLRTLMVGLVKAPVMAFIIALIATNEGLKVEGSSESLGRHTTASVVKSIFMVIVADGLFAMFFAAIGF